MEETKEIEIPSFIKADPSFLIDHVEPVEPSEQELKMLEGTRTAIQQLEAERDEEPIMINERKMFIDMIKVMALVECGYAPLDNPSNLYTKEKQLVIDAMGRLLDYPIETIKEKFNSICDKHIFAPKTDYSQYAVIPQ
jgi:hypothetical protein